MLRLTFAVVVAAVLAVQLLAPWVGGVTPVDVITTPPDAVFFIPAMMGAFLFLLILAPDEARGEMIVWGGIGEVLRMALEAIAGFPVILVLLPGPGFAIGALVAQIHAAKEPRPLLLDRYVAAFTIAAAGLVMPFFLRQAIGLSPMVYDPVLYRLDGTLGFEPAWVFGTAFANFPWLGMACRVAYAFMPTIVLIAASLEFRSAGRPAIGLVVKFIIAAVIGYLLYLLMPAIGPGTVFAHDFPHSPPAPNALPLGPAPFGSGFRNAMPSLHTTWALLAALATIGQRARYRVMIGVAAAAIIAATLGLGEHYLVDLVAACPLVLMVYAISAVELPWHWDRIGCLAGGASLFAAWAWLARAVIIPPPAVMIAFLLLNIVVAVVGLRRLIARTRRVALGCAA